MVKKSSNGMESRLNSNTVTFLDISGVPFLQLEVQALLPQPTEASQAYMDCHVPEAAQEGN
jgi:hypothetical protein